MECAEFSDTMSSDAYGGHKSTAASQATRLFEARESAADLAIGLEGKVPALLLYSRHEDEDKGV